MSRPICPNWGKELRHVPLLFDLHFPQLYVLELKALVVSVPV
jgi:hypothetical protein